jgi:hypothetical protein
LAAFVPSDPGSSPNLFPVPFHLQREHGALLPPPSPDMEPADRPPFLFHGADTHSLLTQPNLFFQGSHPAQGFSPNVVLPPSTLTPHINLLPTGQPLLGHSSTTRPLYTPEPLLTTSHHAPTTPAPLFTTGHHAPPTPAPLFSAVHSAPGTPLPLFTADHHVPTTPAPLFPAVHSALGTPLPLFTADHHAPTTPAPLFPAVHSAPGTPLPRFTASHPAPAAPAPLFTTNHPAPTALAPQFTTSHPAPAPLLTTSPPLPGYATPTVTPAPLLNFHSSSTLPPFVPPLPSQTSSTAPLNANVPSRPASEYKDITLATSPGNPAGAVSSAIAPSHFQLVGPVPVRASGSNSLLLLQPTAPPRLHTFLLQDHSSGLRKREPAEPLLVSAASLAPTLPPPPPVVPIGYAAKRPSIHFEEEELRPKVVFPEMDQDSDISKHLAKENEEGVLQEQDPFSKLENSWGAVRQVGIKCKCFQLRIYLQDYEKSPFSRVRAYK